MVSNFIFLSTAFEPPFVSLYREARGPKEQDPLTRVDNQMMDGDREEHRPTGPKGESGLHRLLPESRAEVGLGQHYMAAAQALENSCAAPAAERAARTLTQQRIAHRAEGLFCQFR